MQEIDGRVVTFKLPEKPPMDEKTLKRLESGKMILARKVLPVPPEGFQTTREWKAERRRLKEARRRSRGATDEVATKDAETEEVG